MIGNPLFAKLPERFRWTAHNLVAHPLSELLYQLGISRPPGSRLLRWSDTVHDWTIPLHNPNEEGRG